MTFWSSMGVQNGDPLLGMERWRRLPGALLLPRLC